MLFLTSLCPWPFLLIIPLYHPVWFSILLKLKLRKKKVTLNGSWHFCQLCTEIKICRVVYNSNQVWQYNQLIVWKLTNKILSKLLDRRLEKKYFLLIDSFGHVDLNDWSSTKHSSSYPTQSFQTIVLRKIITISSSYQT